MTEIQIQASNVTVNSKRSRDGWLNDYISGAYGQSSSRTTDSNEMTWRIFRRQNTHWQTEVLRDFEEQAMDIIAQGVREEYESNPDAFILPEGESND